MNVGALAKGHALQLGPGIANMLFTSPIFLFLFLPLTIIGHFLIRDEYKNAFLFVASSIFYFYGEQSMLLLMYGVITVNYLSALLLGYIGDRLADVERAKSLRLAVTVACAAACIGLLWYFKYWNFTLEMFNGVCSGLGLEYHASLADGIVLPLGISFYTFHVLSYTFDVYLGKMRPEGNWLRLATYVVMFPQLVAGPIVRYIDVRKQFLARVVTAVGFSNGIRRFCFGIAKKVLVANIVAKFADKAFAVPAGDLDFTTAWIGAVCYTLQIYFDFSGYSDMAIGLASMFGFHYKENFNYPYVSKTLGEFWRRWHISLSSWLRDYVYISAGGSRVGKARHYFNLLLVFFLSGLWHGANMTFVLWGLWYGVLIIMENMFLGDFLKGRKLLAHAYALLAIVFGWVMFRADTVGQGLHYLFVMVGGHGVGYFSLMEYLQNDVILCMLIGAVLSWDWTSAYKKVVIGGKKSHVPFLVSKFSGYFIAFLLFVASVMGIISGTHNPFIYFRF